MPNSRYIEAMRVQKYEDIRIEVTGAMTFDLIVWVKDTLTPAEAAVLLEKVKLRLIQAGRAEG